MKKSYFLFLCFLLFGFVADAQLCNMLTNNGQTITTCAARIESSGFSSGDPCYNFGYCDNENDQVTFYSGSGTTPLRMTFLDFSDGFGVYYADLENTFDYLYIYYNATGTGAPAATLTGTYTNPMSFTSPTGYITLKFHSDGSNEGYGFQAILGCALSNCGINSPAGDACSSAPVICDLNGYCGNTSGWYTPDHGWSDPNGYTDIDGYGSGVFCGSIENNSWVAFTAAATSATFSITSGGCLVAGSGIQAQIFSTNCTNSFTSVSSCVSQSAGPGTFTLQATGLTVGTTYHLMIDGFAGNICSYTVTAGSGVVVASISSSAGSTICAGSSTTLSVSATGATGYSWTDGVSTIGTGASVVVSPSSTAHYTCTVTGACGTGTSVTYTLNVTPTPTISVAGTTSICSGSATTLSASGASTYTWSVGSNSSSISVNPSSTTSYTVNGTSSGCVGTPTVVTVNVTPTPTLNPTASPTTICSGASTTLSANPTGGPYNYSWNPGGATTSTVSVSPTSTTVYTLSANNGGICPVTKTVSVNVIATPTVSPIATPTTICSGASTTLSATPTGGPYNYSWNPGGATTSTVSVSPGSTTVYTLTANNGGSCAVTKTVSVNVTPSPTLAPSASPATICSSASTTLNANPTGGPYAYSWNPGGATTSTVSVSPASTSVYTVTATNGGICPVTGTVSITVTPTPTINPTAASPTICSGASTTLNSNPTGGPYVYSWSPGGATTSTVSVNPTSSTVYTLTATNGGSCPVTKTVSVNVTPTPTLAPTASPGGICSGGSSTLNANPTGGPYTYTWSPGGASSSSTSVSPVTSTTYTVVGANGTCTTSATVAVTVTTTPSLTITATGGGNMCSGQSVTLNGSGATTYTWNTGATTGSISVSPPSTTTYTLTGANGTCTSSATSVVTVTTTPTLTLSTSGSNICSGQNVTLSGSGATTYTWNTGATTSSISVSPSSTTTYTLTGANGTCTASATSVVSVTTTPTTSITATGGGNMCSGQSVTLNGSGATTYTWNTGATTSSISVSPSSTTTYTLTGANGTCTSSVTSVVTVTTTPTLTLSTSGSNICSGQNVTLSGSGAATYTWNTGATTSSISVNPSSTTTYTLTGANGTCTASATSVVTVTTTPTMTITGNNPICTGQSITLNGGTAANYSWNTGATTSNITVSPSSNTTYTLTGSNGTCTANAVATVIVNALPTITGSVVTADPCGQPTGGCINSVTASGGLSPYQYSWNGGAFSGTNSYCGIPAGPYSLVVMDANSCTYTTNIIVPSASGPSAPAIASSSTVACIGSNVALSISSPTTGLTFTWTDATGTHSGTTYTVVGIGPSGNYNISVTATDINGCTSTSSEIITVNPLPVISTLATPDTICVGQNTVLNASGASTYTWSSGSTTSTETVSPVTNTTYTVNGTSNLGCVSSETITVVVNPLPVITATATPVICATQSATIGANGATSYTWSTGALTQTTSVSPMTNTTYTVVGDALGCTSTQTVLVNVTPLPSLAITPSPAGICVGQTSTLTASGAATYTWSANAGGGSATTVTVSPVVNTTYTLSGTQNGCSDSITQTITIGTPPTLTAVASQTLICSTQTATLSTSGTATSFTWMPGNGSGSTFTISPSISTVYTVTGTNGGCPSTDTVRVNVTATPTITANSSSGGNICSGQSVTLSATGAPSFTWTPMGVASNTVSVSPNTTTSYTVVGDSANCASVPFVVTVTVTATPTVSISSSAGTTICSGTSTTLTASGAMTYTWSTGPSTTTITVSPTSTTSYTVLANNGACPGMDTLTVAVTPTPTISVSAPPSSICAGQTVTLTATGATHYTWTPTGANTATVAVSPTVTTTYSVASDSSGCNGSQTVTVNVNPMPTGPTLSGAPDSLIECQGSTAQTLSVTPTGTTVTSIPVWYSGGAYVTSGNTYTPPTTTPGFTVYTIADSAAMPNGCVNLSAGNVINFTVTVNPLPTGPILSNLANSVTECQGVTPQSFTVTSTTTGTVTSIPVWYNGTTTVATGTVYTPPNTTPGYTVFTVADSAAMPNGCVNLSAANTVTVGVTVNPMPTGPTLGGAPDTLSECAAPATAGSLSVTPTSTGTVTSIPVWYTSGGAYVTSGNTYTPPNTTPGFTVYTIADSAAMPNGCVNLSAGNVITVTVTVHDNPTVAGTSTISPSNCGSATGGVTGLTPSGGHPGYTYQWFDNTGAVVSTSLNLSNMYTGNYTLIVTDTNGCKSSASAGTFTVPGSAAIAASFTPSTTSGQAPLPVTFTNGSTGATGYNWAFTPNAGDTSSLTNPGFTYSNAGTYTVMLIAHGPNGGCPDTAYATIIVDDATTITIPNVFSPNGDQINDEFIIMCTGMKSLTCDIFNRWGQHVYKLTAPNQTWDGKLNNGNNATEGTYYYMLNAVGENGKTYTYEGPLTLVK